MVKAILISAILIGCMHTIFGQGYINNPSYENLPNLFTNEWTSCHSMSSIDNQPGNFGVNMQASDGASYFSMVSRGNMGPYANNNEDVQLKLKKPLKKDSIYTLSFDVATSPHFGHWVNSFGWLLYDAPVSLEILGSYSKCGPSEKIWTSATITNNNWEERKITFSPQTESFNYLQFKIINSSGIPEFGNLLMDNFHIKDSTVLFKPIIPNIFTPNNDGINDYFVIEDIIEDSELKVFNRWGKLVYERKDYNNRWKGKNRDGIDLSEGVYFYSLSNKHAVKPFTGFIHLQR